MENVNGDNPANNKISSTAKTNKNAVLRKSRSCLEMTTSNTETLSHSKSFNVKPGCSSQESIPECDADNVNQTVPCNIHLTQSSNKTYDFNKTVDNTFVIKTPPSLPLPNQQKTSQCNHHDQNQMQQHQEKQQQQSYDQTQQQLSKQLQANIQMTVTSTATAAVSTDTIITSATSTTSIVMATTSTAIATTSTTSTTPRANATSKPIATTLTAIVTTSITSNTSKAVATTSIAIAKSTAIATTSPIDITLKQQSAPSAPTNLKLSEKSLEPVLPSHTPFSPPTPNITKYSTWLPQVWQHTKVEQFHDDQPSLNQPEAEEITDISTEAAPTDHGLSHGKQAQPKTVVCITPTGTLSTMSRSRSVTCSNQPQPLSKSLSAPEEKTDFEDSTPQKTTPTFTLNDPGSSESSVHAELNSPVSSASLVYADYASVPHSSSSPQLSSMPSWTTMSSNSSMSSIESAILSIKSSNSSLSSWPTARISPMASSTGSIFAKEKRTDFILLSAIADQEEAENYRAHLKIDIGIPDLTIDLFSEIDSGRTAMMSLETLHERYNNILVLCTINLEGDSYSRFLHENLLTTGLQDAQGKEDRVIPVWTSRDCTRKIMEFRCIIGFQYYNFLSDKTSALARVYVKTVKNAVNDGRKKCR